MTIEHSSAVPLYAQLESEITTRIQNGDFPPNSRLPSEDELVEEYSVSRTTVRNAVQNLLKKGLVEIRRGKGTFVTSPRIVQELTGLTGFVEDMAALGRKASAKWLDHELLAADETVAEQLACPIGTEVMCIRRIRLSDGVPLSFDITYLPYELGRQIVSHDLEVEPIFTLLETRYDTPLIEAEYRLQAISADQAIADALSVSAGSPVFLIERTSYSRDHQPVDFERLYYRGDHIRFTTRLARRVPGAA
ncbi:GntR family transcriptional regulator [Sphingomonas mali]|uniref:GntR family transcriptional regulator n=1 Tax=Sphingomonas mali TaxID=40682 RepID=UPI00083022B3|nr:GntR family transcriptional regulator [Sphingomonas mali]